MRIIVLLPDVYNQFKCIPNNTSRHCRRAKKANGGVEIENFYVACSASKKEIWNSNCVLNSYAALSSPHPLTK